MANIIKAGYISSELASKIGDLISKYVEGSMNIKAIMPEIDALTKGDMALKQAIKTKFSLLTRGLGLL